MKPFFKKITAIATELNARSGLGLVSVPFFLAQGPQGPTPAVGTASTGIRDFFILVGALLLVSIILALVLTTARNRRRLRRLNTHHHKQQVFPDASANVQRPRRRRRRRGGYEDFPMNPTLAETGGLPPQRTEEADLSTEQQPH
jgi:hypothetical protein